MASILTPSGVAPDAWHHVDDDGALPVFGDITVSLQRWLGERDSLRERGAGVGVRLQPEDDARLLADDVGALALVCCALPRFADGRAYSQARILREQLGYVGELRATGEVLRDQAFYLRRVGFDAFEVPDGRDAAALAAGLRDFSVTYQAAADGRAPVYG